AERQFAPFPLTLTLSLRESLHSLWRMHWDHEPERAQCRAGVSPAQRARQRERFRSVGVADGGRRDACPTLRFMEREQPASRRRKPSGLDCSPGSERLTLSPLAGSTAVELS